MRNYLLLSLCLVLGVVGNDDLFVVDDTFFAVETPAYGAQQQVFQSWPLETIVTDAMGVLDSCGLGGIMDAMDTASALAFGVDQVGEDGSDMDGIGVMMSGVTYLQTIARVVCGSTEEQKFVGALSDFKMCSGFDLKEFIEDLPSAMVGTVLECVLTYFRETNALEMAGLLGPPKMSQGCANDFVGANPFGDLVRNMYLYPDKVFPCFLSLSQSLPECTLETWPIPLVGSWLAQAACAIGSSKALLDDVCEADLKALQQCIKDEYSTSDCYGIIVGCADESFSMNLPIPLVGGPLPDACTRVAKSRGLTDALDRYSKFQAQCVEVWTGWSTENSVDEPDQDTASVPQRDKKDKPMVGASSKGEKDLGLSAPTQDSGSTGSHLGGFVGLFLGGTVFGMLVVALVVYRRERKMRKEFVRVASSEDREIEINSSF